MHVYDFDVAERQGVILLARQSINQHVSKLK